MSKKALADRLRVEDKTIRNWESGDTEPKASQVAALCDALGVCADYLLGRTDRENVELIPGHWLVDDDRLHAALTDPRDIDASFGWRIPHRFRIITDQEAGEIVKAVEARKRGGKP